MTKPQHGKYIVYAGRMSSEKNIPGLMRSVKMVRETFPRTWLILIGASEQDTVWLIEEAERAGIADQTFIYGWTTEHWSSVEKCIINYIEDCYALPHPLLSLRTFPTPLL